MSSLHHSDFYICLCGFPCSHLNLCTQKMRQSCPTNHLSGSKDSILFLSFILPLYYTVYQPLHFLFLTVVHSCLLPLHSSCSLHRLCYPTFSEFICLKPGSFQKQTFTSYIFLFSSLQYLQADALKGIL